MSTEWKRKNLKLKRTKMAGVMGFPCGNHLEHVWFPGLILEWRGDAPPNIVMDVASSWLCPRIKEQLCFHIVPCFSLQFKLQEFSCTIDFAVTSVKASQVQKRFANCCQLSKNLVMGDGWFWNCWYNLSLWEKFSSHCCAGHNQGLKERVVSWHHQYCVMSLLIRCCRESRVKDT
jgi:hypothetical protein